MAKGIQILIMSFPDIDVIIPTYNSERTLERCLSSIKNQDYDGELVITIIDGGSYDGTKRIAEKYRVNFIEKKGMYGVGKNGARHFGESITNAPFIWLIDSDNILVERTVAERLIKPLLKDSTLNISMPMISIDKSASSFNNYFSLKEISNVSKFLAYSYKNSDGYYYFRESPLGLPNSSMIRRKAIEAVGGFDTDVRTFYRMRRIGLSSGVIDTKSHYYHNQTDSIFEFLKKWDRRIKKYSSMNEDELRNYFVEWPLPQEEDRNLKTGAINTLLYDHLYDIWNLIKFRKWIYAWGPIYSLFMLFMIISHPYRYYRAFKKFL